MGPQCHAAAKLGVVLCRSVWLGIPPDALEPDRNGWSIARVQSRGPRPLARSRSADPLHGVDRRVVFRRFFNDRGRCSVVRLPVPFS